MPEDLKHVLPILGSNEIWNFVFLGDDYVSCSIMVSISLHISGTDWFSWSKTLSCELDVLIETYFSYFQIK